MSVSNLGKVAVLMGGRSAEREVSLMSGQGVLQALRASGVNAHAFDPAERDLSELKREGFDRCFIALHGRYGEDGTVQGALELLGIPYTGSGVMASSIAMDKTMTKRVWLAEGLPTPNYVLVRREQLGSVSMDGLIQALGLPMIVKPAREGSSIGVSKVEKIQDLPAALAAAAQCDADILCEQCIVGDEVTCPVLGEGDSSRALPVIRIVAPAGNYDYQNKYFTDDTQYLVPCGLPEGEEARIQALVLEAFKTLGCRGWARADVMIDAITALPLARLRAEEKALRFAAIQMTSIGLNIALNVIAMVFFFSAERPEEGILFILLANLISSLAKPLLLYDSIFKVLFIRDWSLYKRMWRYAIPLVIAGFAGIINETFDRILLKHLLYDPAVPESLSYAESQVGIYSACYKLAMLVTIILQAYRYAAEPFFFKQMQNQDRNTVYVRIMNIFVAMVCAVFLLVSLNLDIFKHFIQKEAYSGLSFYTMVKNSKSEYDLLYSKYN